MFILEVLSLFSDTDLLLFLPLSVDLGFFTVNDFLGVLVKVFSLLLKFTFDSLRFVHYSAV